MSQLFRYDCWVKTAQGPAVPGAAVFAVDQPANLPSSLGTSQPSPLAPIFADPGGLVPIAQPIFTDGFGHASFYMVPQFFTLAVYFGGSLSQFFADQVAMGAALVSPTPTPTLQLKTNGTPNAVQSVLNLAAGENIVLTADGSGDVTIDSPQTPLVGSEGAFFFGPGITDMAAVLGGFSWNGVSANKSNGAYAANVVLVYLFQLFESFTIREATAVDVGSDASSTASFGIYDSNGNKVLDAGSFVCNPATLSQTNPVNGGTPVTLPPGLYYHAQAGSTASASVQFTPGITVTSSAANVVGTLLKNFPTRIAIAANPMVSGVLPATLGALTTYTPTQGNGDGIVCPLYE